MGGSGVWFFGVSVLFSSISHIHQQSEEGHLDLQLLRSRDKVGEEFSGDNSLIAIEAGWLACSTRIRFWIYRCLGGGALACNVNLGIDWLSSIDGATNSAFTLISQLRPLNRRDHPFARHHNGVAGR